MSLEKAIKRGKEHRKPYYGSGRFDWTCRPHGGCPYCLRGRMHKFKKALLAAKEQLDTRE